MKIRFWGVRGSIAVPGPTTVRYGGNTSCVSVECDDRTLIFDAGTGIRECGNHLMSKSKNGVRASIFISHTHWDHIQGFPFFAPSYIPGNSFTVHGPASDVRNLSLKEIMAMQTNYEYFPVRIDKLGADLKFMDCTDGKLTDIQNEPFEIHTCRLNHPVVCYAYKLIHNGKVYVYGGDHEPYRNISRDHNGASSVLVENAMIELDRTVEQQNVRIENFCRGADLVSWDSQYTAQEYASKKGWGHSWHEHNIEFAERAQIKHFVFTHHDPLSSDEKLEPLERTCAEAAQQKEFALDFAKEGMEIEL